MADAKQCNKCQRYMNLTSWRVEITVEFKFQGQKKTEHLDLCTECQTKFYEFLKKQGE